VVNNVWIWKFLKLNSLDSRSSTKWFEVGLTSCEFHVARYRLEKVEIAFDLTGLLTKSGANPLIVSYNATSGLGRFKDKNKYFLEKMV
jgi:hypothetical protein